MAIPAMRVPFMFIEFNSERAFQGSNLLTLNTCLIGQKTSAGTGAALSLTRITSAAEAKTLAGAGSQVHKMAEAFFANNKVTPCYILLLEDHGSGVAASGTLTVTGPATAAGTINLYIAGKKVPVSVAASDAQNDIAAAINAAVNADTSLPVTSSVDANVVTLLAKNDGTPGNSIDVRLNYNTGDATPAGVSVAIVAMASGATDVDIQTAFDAIGDEWIHLFVSPYFDSANLTAIKAELDARFGPTTQNDGYYITARTGSLSTLATFGALENSKYTVFMNANKVPETPWQVAAATAAQVALEGSIDPARPFQTLELKGISPPKTTDRFTMLENNSLLADGISTIYVDNGGAVRIQRIITAYQTNPLGADDPAYYDLNTLLTLSYLRYSFRNWILTKYPRAKLADDGIRIPSGQSIMTPSVGKAEAISWFRSMADLGLVENIEQFKKDLVVQRSSTDVNRMEWILPPDLVNQFIVGAAEIQFLLQSP